MMVGGDSRKVAGPDVVLICPDRRIGQTIQRFFSQNDVSADLCLTAREAISFLDDKSPMAVLVDLTLPADVVFKLCWSADEKLPDAELILFVAKDFPEEGGRVLKADRLVRKPISRRSLTAIVELLRERKERLKAAKRPAPVESSRDSVSLDGFPGQRGQEGFQTFFAMVGNLKETPFPAILYKNFANGNTGVLTIQQEARTRTLYLLDGEVAYATSTSSSQSLASVLVKSSTVDVRDVAAAMETHGGDKSLGQSLLSLNLITPEVLAQALDRQVYERVLSCFAFHEGKYSFIPDPNWVEEFPQYPQNSIELIHDGVQRYVSPNVLAEQLQKHLEEYAVRTEKFDSFLPHFPTTGQTEQWLEKIDGSRSVQDLSLEAKNDVIELLRLVWGLHLADMIGFSPTPQTTAQRSPHKMQLPSRPAGLSSSNSGISISGVKLTREEKTLESAILGYHLRLTLRDPRKLLGLGEHASKEDIKGAFQKAVTTLKSSAVNQLPEPTQKKCRILIRATEKAYRQLIEGSPHAFSLSPNSDANLISKIQDLQPVVDGESHESVTQDELHEFESALSSFGEKNRPEGENLSESEIIHDCAHVHYARARDAAQKQKWEAAFQSIKKAVEIDPHSPELISFHAWVVFHLPCTDRNRQLRVCKGRVELALSLSNCMPDAHYFYGRMSLVERDFAAAFRSFMCALDLNAQHPQAKHYLSLLKERGITAESAQDDHPLAWLRRWRDKKKVD